MSDCVNKKSCIDYARLGENAECYLCPDYKAPMTNADSIRAMSDEKLAKFLESSHGCPTDDDCEYGRHAKIESCIKHWENWLRQPAEGEQYD